MDEFIYQFQANEFNKSRACVKGDTEEIKKMNGNKWNIITIFKYLDQFISKSKILEILSRPHKDGESILNGTGYKHLLQLFGYMSLQGMLRLNCLIGDYRYAIQVAQPIIHLGRSKLSEITPISHIDSYYYLSFSFMMLKRYNECYNSLQYILTYIEKSKQYIQSRSYRYQQLSKKTEQLYSILTIVLSLCPQAIDHYLWNRVNEKSSESIEQIRDGDINGYEQLFISCAPKFVSATPINFEIKEDKHSLTYHLQKELFLSDVKQLLSLPKISSYLKLYTSIESSKLAKLCNLESQDLIKILLSTKHKTRKMIDSIKMRGESHGVNFFVVKDMLHANDKHEKNKKISVDEFITQSNKLQRIRFSYLNN